MNANNILVKGFVKDEIGNPVPNSIVSFSKSPQPLQDISTLTDEDGKFIISVPSEGKYQLTINAEGFDLRRVDFEADKGREVSLNINLKKN